MFSPVMNPAPEQPTSRLIWADQVPESGPDGLIDGSTPVRVTYFYDSGREEEVTVPAKALWPNWCRQA